MNKKELIKAYEGAPFSIVSINGVLEDLKRLDEPQPIKLKDVIARIEKFDLGTKAVWINEILYKLGSDYGLHKYYAGYKQGKFDGDIEREKPAVPQFVADWIEECKNDDFHLFGAMEGISSNQKKLDYWFREDDNMELFARAWLDGYTVEKEKRYLVKIIGITNYNSYLNYHKGENKWTIESSMETDAIRTKHTRKQLEIGGFGWVFDCEGMEVEEVE